MEREANPDPVISITGRWKIIWYLSLLKAPIPSAPKIFPAKLNKRGERSFDAYWGEGVVERKPAQQAESWWQCRQKNELLKILSKKRNSHGTGSFMEHFLPSPLLCISHQELDLGFWIHIGSTDLVVTLKDKVALLSHLGSARQLVAGPGRCPPWFSWKWNPAGLSA